VTDGRALAREFLEQQRLLGGIGYPAGWLHPRHPGLAARGQLNPRVNAALTPGASPGKTKAGPAQSNSAVPPPGSPTIPRRRFVLERPGCRRLAHSGDRANARCRGLHQVPACEGRRAHRPRGRGGDGPAGRGGRRAGRVEDETGRPFVGRRRAASPRSSTRSSCRASGSSSATSSNAGPPREPPAAVRPRSPRACHICSARSTSLKPSVILAMGRKRPAQTLLIPNSRWDRCGTSCTGFRGIPLIVTYHPAALLRNPNWKKPTWMTSASPAVSSP